MQTRKRSGLRKKAIGPRRVIGPRSRFLLRPAIHVHRYTTLSRPCAAGQVCLSLRFVRCYSGHIAPPDLIVAPEAPGYSGDREMLYGWAKSASVLAVGSVLLSLGSLALGAEGTAI